MGRKRGALALFALGVLLSGCVTVRPITPYPDMVTVPRPGQADARRSFDQLREDYTTSPQRNPDGLGVFEAIEPRSSMTLWVPEIQEQWEEANRVAYARSPLEQAAVLARVREFHAAHVVFEGVLLSPAKEFSDARWYLPEGIYLVDDAGRKFMPQSVEENKLRTEYLAYLPPVSQYSSTADIPRWSTGFPRITFAGDAITPATRAITLYFAAAAHRVSFTWVFDPAFVPQRQSLGPQHGAGMNRLFGQP